MKNIVLTLVVSLFLLTDSSHTEAASEFLISAIFADHMVLQRDRPTSIWGWAACCSVLLAARLTEVPTHATGIEANHSRDIPQ